VIHMKNSLPENTQHYDVVIIGGGASGLMTALVAAEHGKSVCILEKNKTAGNKLSITGGGRCNITNATFDVHEFLKNYGDSADFLYSPFSQFSASDTFEFFASRGLPLVTQARNRAFPASERAPDVTDFFLQHLQSLNVQIHTGSRVRKLITDGSDITGVDTGSRIITGDNYVLATGGVSHPETGSTGDGFKWLRDIGHTVTDPTPTIVPLAVRDRWVHNLSGVDLSFMKITFFCDGVKQFSKTGKILFTHFGISGPLILNSSSQVAGLLKWGTVTASIDMYPDTDMGALERNILKVFDTHKNKLLKNVLSEIVPTRLADTVMGLLPDIDYSTPVHSVSRDDRKRIAGLLKNMPMSIKGLMGFDRAVIADGGVPLTEIDTRTFRSMKYTNLYITGDLLHVNRPSGGYSLQLCWTSGYVVGKNM